MMLALPFIFVLCYFYFFIFLAATYQPSDKSFNYSAIYSSDFSNAFLELALGVGFLFLIILILSLIIVVLFAVPLFLEAYASRLIVCCKYILQQTSTMFNFGFYKGFGNPEDKVISKQGNSQNSFVRAIYSKIDEEGIAYLSDRKFEWKNLGLTQSQVERRGLFFALDYHRGRFIAWIGLSEFLFSINTKK
jgi:hypothetical protein